jgi:DNA invertase Pin-like site-specific DNA recombinase
MPTNRIFLYARVSTDQQDSSSRQQIQRLEEFCKRKGFENAEYLIDFDVSGGKEIFKRPNGSKLKEAKDGDIIIVHKRDRLFRNTLNALNTVWKWFDDGVTLYILENGEDPISMDNPTSKLVFTIMCATDELEKDKVRTRTKDSLALKKANKEVYCTAPYGWENSYTEKNSKGEWINGKLIPNENEQVIIRDIKEWHKQGHSLNKIADNLNVHRVTSKKGGRWSAKTVSDVINNSLNS